MANLGLHLKYKQSELMFPFMQFSAVAPVHQKRGMALLDRQGHTFRAGKG